MQLEHGEYVLFSDVEQMKSDHEKKCAEMQKEIDGLKEINGRWCATREADGRVAIELIEKWKSKCAELEKSNAELVAQLIECRVAIEHRHDGDSKITLLDVICKPLPDRSCLDRLVSERCNPLVDALEKVKSNDKTYYLYRGQGSDNEVRHAITMEWPPAGQRWKTPKEIAIEALSEYGKGKGNESHHD